jgi:hypothetical protein
MGGVWDLLHSRYFCVSLYFYVVPVFLCCSMYCLFFVLFCALFGLCRSAYCLCVNVYWMCIVLLPPGGYPIAVKKYNIISFLPSVLDQFQVSASWTPVNGPQVALNTKLRVSRLQILFQDIVTLAKEIKQCQKNWLQHVQRMDTNRIPKQAV